MRQFSSRSLPWCARGCRRVRRPGGAQPWCAAGLGSAPGSEGASSSRGGWWGEGPRQSCCPTGMGPACLAGSSTAAGEMSTSEWSSRPAPLSHRGETRVGQAGTSCPTATVAGHGELPGSSATFCGGRGSTIVVTSFSITRASQRHGIFSKCKPPLGTWTVFCPHQGWSQREKPWCGCIFTPVSQGPI